MKKRLQLKIRGRVQGVFYRAGTLDMAKELNLTGWVKNCSDGSVELVAEGEEELLNKFLNWCQKGPPGAEVVKIDQSWEEARGEFNRFEIRY